MIKGLICSGLVSLLVRVTAQAQPFHVSPFQPLAIQPSILASSQPLKLASAEENREPQDVFDGMRESFRPERAHDVHARYQFDLSGPRGGKWWIEVADGVARHGRGTISHPDVTFIATDKDWVALSNGRLSGVWATLTGRLKIRGNQLLARKLDEMFP